MERRRQEQVRHRHHQQPPQEQGGPQGAPQQGLAIGQGVHIGRLPILQHVIAHIVRGIKPAPRGLHPVEDIRRLQHDLLPAGFQVITQHRVGRDVRIIDPSFLRAQHPGGTALVQQHLRRAIRYRANLAQPVGEDGPQGAGFRVRVGDILPGQVIAGALEPAAGQVQLAYRQPVIGFPGKDQGAVLLPEGEDVAVLQGRFLLDGFVIDQVDAGAVFPVRVIAEDALLANAGPLAGVAGIRHVDAAVRPFRHQGGVIGLRIAIRPAVDAAQELALPIGDEHGLFPLVDDIQPAAFPRKYPRWPVKGVGRGKGRIGKQRPKNPAQGGQ